jgi:hypothetical protein
MKRTAVCVLALVLLINLGGLAKVRVIPGTYSTGNGDFYTKFWKEMFKGGCPGQVGNTLMALGEGFIFNQAKLQLVEASDNPAYMYKTTYVGGKLTLNSSVPWLESGILRATHVTATNYSIQDPVTGELSFLITLMGDFDKVPYSFAITATYDGNPEVKYDDMGRPVFQRGTDFEVEITISPKI